MQTQVSNLENVLAYTIPRCNSNSLGFRVKVRYGSIGLRVRVGVGVRVRYGSIGLRFRVRVGVGVRVRYSSMGLRF